MSGDGSAWWGAKYELLPEASRDWRMMSIGWAAIEAGSRKRPLSGLRLRRESGGSTCGGPQDRSLLSAVRCEASSCARCRSQLAPVGAQASFRSYLLPRCDDRDVSGFGIRVYPRRISEKSRITIQRPCTVPGHLPGKVRARNPEERRGKTGFSKSLFCSNLFGKTYI